METLDNMLIKYDALSVEALDKIHVCLDLLIKYGYVKPERTLKETYEKVIGIYNIERNDPKMWKMVWEHKILSLFQMEQQSGIQGIKIAKPKSVKDLCALNSIIRLMCPEGKKETPLITWARYRKNIKAWYREMEKYGLTKEEIEWLSNYPTISDGIAESQECLMSLVQEEKLGGNSLTFADKCRKGLAKKDGPLFKECEEEYYKNAKEKGCSEKLVHYVWEELLAVQRGYSFNRSHCLAYSLMGLQEMNLAYKFPIIFWNTACLITDSGALEDNGNTNYGKVAKALGTILSRGIEVSLVNINESNYIFEPDVKNNRIMFGMQAVNGLNSSAIEQIIENRPYVSFTDFMNRCSLNKTAMVSLIKSGAFDGLEKEWSEELGVNPRIVIMSYYLLKISGQKTKITMQNFSGLIKKELIPDKLNFHKKLFEFNKYIKAYKKKENYYVLDESSCLKFYKTFFDEDNLSIIGGTPCVYQKLWDKLYKKKMATAKQWIEEYQDEILKEFNYLLFKEQWDKYASGNISSWEMDSLCFYYHDHELKNINKEKYGVENFFNLSEDAEVDYWFKRGNNQIPIYKLRKIAGTVIEKDDNHSSISLLTVEGVVTVKFSKDNYALYAKQIAEENNEGVKEVKEKSWFSRGTKLLLTGYRRDNTFVIKTYKNTPTHQVYLISDVKSNGDLELSHLRYGQSEV